MGGFTCSGCCMSTIESLKAAWPATYLLLFVHLAIATFVFRNKVATRLVNAGIYSDASMAARHSVVSYLLSSCLVLAISHPTLNIVFGANEAFDIRLLPMGYQWLGRIILTPISIIGNLYILKLLSHGAEAFKQREVLRIVASSERPLFLVNILFAVFYV